jgi:hypothetical protein
MHAKWWWSRIRQLKIGRNCSVTMLDHVGSRKTHRCSSHSTQAILTFPTITLGRSKISLLIEKQNVHGTGRLVGESKIHVVKAHDSVLSNACIANFSQYSTADWLSISYKGLISCVTSLRAQKAKDPQILPHKCTFSFQVKHPCSNWSIRRTLFLRDIFLLSAARLRLVFQKSWSTFHTPGRGIRIMLSPCPEQTTWHSHQ